MNPRVLFASLALLIVATAAPALAIGGGPPVSTAGSGATFEASTTSEAAWSGASLSASPAAASRGCEASLRGFMGRNTLRPSVRREALARCEADASQDVRGSNPR